MHVWGVARSENPGGLIVLGGENVPPHKMSVGMLICQKLGGIETPSPSLATALSYLVYGAVFASLTIF